MTKPLEKNSVLTKEAKDLKREQEIQLVTLCEAMEQKKKAMEDKLMAEEEKRQMAIKLEERTFEVHKLTSHQLDMINQEANKKDLEITNLRSQNEQLKSELRHEKELMERMNKSNEPVKHFEELLRSPRTRHLWTWIQQVLFIY